jgi:hypothetical protein
MPPLLTSAGVTLLTTVLWSGSWTGSVIVREVLIFDAFSMTFFSFPEPAQEEFALPDASRTPPLRAQVPSKFELLFTTKPRHVHGVTSVSARCLPCATPRGAPRLAPATGHSAYVPVVARRRGHNRRRDGVVVVFHRVACGPGRSERLLHMRRSRRRTMMRYKDSFGPINRFAQKRVCCAETTRRSP